MSRGFVRRTVERRLPGGIEQAEDSLAEEVPVALVFNDQPFAVMMATPGDLDDFARGFALSEGLVEHAAQIRDVSIHERLEGIEVAVTCEQTPAALQAGPGHERLLPGRSGCGLCGARTLEDAVRQPRIVGRGPAIDAATLERALGALREGQSLNRETGAVHAAAWADDQGHIVLVREDVGRHNALDKLVGAMGRAGVDVEHGFALVTSRASYEMVTKATAAGITLMAAISAPTALAVQLARSAGLTLVGFARPGRHVVYSHPERLRT
ncbi:formate dehydrogenase accessory sulfurtransferase FdhD [Oleiagrimonas sp. C23AA]|uniref:formate dehydrogenase accessory sulfurtransferase FdhD n=1 Tax=Oleiagrimonas sp. C23AA TaxID=2719047 RepID=UPI0014235317|nr:formate dehydrogenase accessory sulfurtransferase FdhD [Oleiagrimonas sp. C23AA]NII11240.1 formate dehydrogenase accessory sulfurtransferase FdhD [Oleiagrimonas sp. C23AA]